LRIDSGTIGMDSARLYKSSTSVRYSVESHASSYTTTDSQLASTFSQYLTKQDTKESECNGEENTATQSESENLTPDAQGKEDALTTALNKMGLGSKTKLYSISTRDDTKTTFQKLHELLIQNIIELIFGERLKNKKDLSDLDASGSEEFPTSYELVTTNNYAATYYEEYESTSFQASGLIKTDDGREIDINVNISMSRRFVETYSECLTTLSYRCTDPLVINLSDAPASLSDVKFFFDLDADGEEEEISQLNVGNGYLALDKNGDGVINDGSELFGTKSGDGFKDLAAYDEDGNGWIDENDSIFEKLKIFCMGEDGNSILYTLKDKDVGAIYLGNSDTQFALNSQTNDSTNGFIRKTGIFLYESGAVGTVQHVDLVS